MAYSVSQKVDVKRTNCLLQWIFQPHVYQRSLKTLECSCQRFVPQVLAFLTAYSARKSRMAPGGTDVAETVYSAVDV